MNIKSIIISAIVQSVIFATILIATDNIRPKGKVEWTKQFFQTESAKFEVGMRSDGTVVWRKAK